VKTQCAGITHREKKHKVPHADSKVTVFSFRKLSGKYFGVSILVFHSIHILIIDLEVACIAIEAIVGSLFNKNDINIYNLFFMIFPGISLYLLASSSSRHINTKHIFS